MLKIIDSKKCIATFLRIFMVIGFLAIFLFLYSHLSNLMRPKQGTADLVHGFYELDKNTIDVVFVGSSLVYYGIQPNILWNEFGITSFDLASPSQSFPCSYYMIQEFLRYQSPKVLVLDVYSIWNDQLYYNPGRLHSASDPLRLDSIKINMLSTMLKDKPITEQIPYYLTLDLYHSRWKELKDADFYTPSFLKGSNLSIGIFETTEVPVPEEKGIIPEVVLEYFDKIVKLCQERNIQLVLIQIPHGKYNGDDWPTFTYDSLTICNSFFDYIDENYDIPYKYYAKTGELGLDYSSDFYESAHLNPAGSDKLTLNVGNYIDDMYNLPDHRGDTAFTQWDKDYEIYIEERNK